ncbi:MAG: dCTP deaminase [Alphaproteobacteria bacterium]|nr:dCTP deaminase [Alphaproteobacteria bacterium]
MILSNRAIGDAVETRRITITPFEPRLMRPASYLLRLGSRWRSIRFDGRTIDTALPLEGQVAPSPAQEGDALTVRPGEFILAESHESIGLSNDLAGMLSTISHLARLGVAVHLASNWVNPGFGGGTPTKLALEISCAHDSPVILHAGWPVCHIAFANVADTVDPTMLRGPSIYEGKDPLDLPRYAEEFVPIVGAMT